MHNSKIKRISLAVCFALLPMAASAAGLGKLTVISGLGEPLNAEVELSASKEELGSITANIAPAEVFAEQGIERVSALSGVRIDVATRPDGVPVLRLSSAQPISDPFLDMLVQVEWSSGRLLREYTALLDPPGYGDKAGVAAPAPSVTAAALPVADKTASKSRSRKNVASAAPVATEVAPAGEVTVQKGDTLQEIALANQADGVSLEQMLVGLYRANENAFVGNMNRLKVGQILRVPPAEELQALSQSDAVKEVRVQSADWNAYRNKLAGMVAESAPAREEPSAQVATGKITAPAEDKSVPEQTGPRDVVKLSKSESGDVKGRLTALQEESTAREKAIKESTERVAMLEKQLQDMQKLLEIKNKSLADAQTAAKPAPAAESKPAEPAKVEQAKPEIAPVTEPAAEIVTPPPTEASVAEKAPEPAKKPARKPKKIVRPAPPPPAEPGMFDDPLGNPLLLAGGGGLLALVAAAWFYMRNKRRKGLDSFEQGILTTGGLKPNTVFGNTAGGTVDTGNTSFLTDFGQGGAAGGMIDTNDVDPIAEAEVYMAYGRDVQAEEILKDAIAKEPKRHELHLKLLEIFANRKDNGAFETLAGELYASLGATDPVWAKVAEMGRKLEPENPLYGDSGTHPLPAEPAPVDFDATMIQQAPAADDAGGLMDIGLGAGDASLDFSLDEPAATEAEAVPVAADSNELDFDIGGLELPAAEPASATSDEGLPDIGAMAEMDLPLLGDEAPVTEASPAVEESLGLDFPLDLPEAAAEDSAQLDMADLDVGELSGLEVPETAADADPAGLALDMPGDDVAAGSDAPMMDLDLPELELPGLEEVQAENTETVSEETAVNEIALDLDLPALETEESVAVSLELPESAAIEAEEISLDLPVDESISLDIDAGAEDVAPSISSEPEETIDLSLPPETEVAAKPSKKGKKAAKEVEPEPVVEPEVAAASDLDFDFSVDLGETPDAAESPAAAAPDLDLSEISLDLGGPTEVEPEEITLEAGNESPDVDTKLDLVTAYIDMGDQEGARELLQEVLQEGGPAQKARAQKLLDDLA